MTRRAWPLALKLPLLMTGLLAVLLAATLALTYVTLTRSAMVTAEERLHRAGDQLSSLAANSVGQRRAQLSRATSDSTLRLALLAQAATAEDRVTEVPSPALTAARASLQRLISAGDDGVTVELWSEDGRRVAFAGRDIRSGELSRPPDAETQDPAVPARGFDTLGGFDAVRQSDSPYVGGLYVADSSAYFWAVAPVRAGGERLGYLLRQFRIARSERADDAIRALTSSDVSTYYRDTGGTPWVTVSGDTASAPASRDSVEDRLIVSRPGVGDLLAVEAPIMGTRLVLVMEHPVRSVLAAPRASVRQLAMVSLVLLVIGGVASWLVSRRITRPLVALTGAAEALGGGDYGARVVATGDDELVRLANSFNRMVSEVGTAHAELEVQTEEAQATAEELDRSNGELAAALADLEERETQFRVLADTIPHLSWMAGADGSIFWCNDRWHSYTGASPDEVRRWGWRSVDAPQMRAAAAERWRSCITDGTPFEMELPLRRADGHVRWFLTRARPVHDAEGRVARWFGTDTDIQALREAREGAESARADAELARAQAESANRAKSEFLAVMSHELRTPLNAIGGYTELLELGLRGPVTDTQRHDLDRIRTNQQHLLGLISGVLDLSRIEAGRVSYDLAAVPLDEFLAGLNSLVEPQAAAKSLTLAYVPCALGLAVCADREKLRQILLNLLSNAIRYTPPGGRIEIAGAAAGDGQVEITVRDTGIGIAPEAIEQIFQPFVQLDRSLTRVREGVGLGLAISLDLARGMSGELSAASSAGEGSCFTLRIPAA
ncbi:MAG: sensor histidine kinase [Gemmatimonadaceae bacterium]